MLMKSPGWYGSDRHKCVVISDLHFPRKDSHPKYLYEFLLNTPSDMIIILGDFFEGYDKTLGEFSEWHLRCLDLLHKKKMEEGVKVIFVPGNHDQYLRHDKILNHTLYGSEYMRSLVLDGHGGQRTFLTHGDDFDQRIVRDNDMHVYQAAQAVKVARVSLAVLYNYFSGSDHKLKKAFERKETGELKGKLVREITQAANDHGCNAVLAGHTHKPQPFKKYKKDIPVRYGNTGSFVGKQASAMVLTRDDEWQVVNWRQRREALGLTDLPDKSEHNPGAQYRDLSLQEVHFNSTLQTVWLSRYVLEQAMRTIDTIRDMALRIEDEVGLHEEEMHRLLRDAAPQQGATVVAVREITPVLAA